MKGKNTLNETERRNTVQRTFALVNGGHKMIDARKQVAHELGIGHTTIYTWQRDLNMTPPNTNGTIDLVGANNLVPKETTSAITIGVSAVKNHLGNVFNSLVTKDGRFNPKEASAICQVSSNILGFARFELEVRKQANKTLQNIVL